MSRILANKVGRLVLTFLVVVAVATAVTLSVRAYPTASETPAAASDASRVETVVGSDSHRVILTAEAAGRLGIKTGQIQAAQPGGHPSIPYSAVLYDADGSAWTYTSPEPLAFVRQKLTIDTIQGDLAMLTDGPPAGTAVVTVGAPELYGTEFGVGGDE
jgi:hypothetical protein